MRSGAASSTVMGVVCVKSTSERPCRASARDSADASGYRMIPIPQRGRARRALSLSAPRPRVDGMAPPLSPNNLAWQHEPQSCYVALWNIAFAPPRREDLRQPRPQLACSRPHCTTTGTASTFLLAVRPAQFSRLDFCLHPSKLAVQIKG